MAKILEPGTPAPDFTLQVTPDQNLSLGEFRGRPVILAFYPFDNIYTPPHVLGFDEGGRKGHGIGAVVFRVGPVMSRAIGGDRSQAGW